jgi:hypothetical protein
VSGAGKKQKSRIVPFRIDEDDFTLLDALARQTSCSCGEVLRRCLAGIQLKTTIDAQALTEVSRVHANLNAIGGGFRRPRILARGVISSQAALPSATLAQFAF